MRCAVDVQYNSPMDATASYDQSSGAVAVNQSSGYAQNFKVTSGSATAERSGASRRDASMVQMLNSDMTPCTNGNPAYMNLAQKDGSVQKFSVATGQVESTRTAKGATVSKGSYDSQVQVQKDSMGQISSIQSSRDGMMQFERTATKLTVSHYSKNQMMAQRSRGVALAAMVPAKSYSYDWNASSKTMSIVNQEAGKDPVHIERKVEDNKVTIIKGLGDDRVVSIYERNFLPGGKWEEIKTVKGINDTEPTSCVRTVKQSTSGGWLTLSETKGYGTSLAQTTTYTYNEQFRVSLELKPDGGYTKYAYDTQGRVVMEASPWANGDYEKVVRTTYADLRFNDYRPSSVIVLLKDSNGVETETKRTEYEYMDSPQINRTTTRVIVPGAVAPLVSIEESYGEAASNAYSRGRTKMTQDERGIQQVFTYENTTSYGASWKVTTETQVNGALVSKQSKRSVEYRAADETVVREEEYVHTGNEWSLISSASYEYDDQKRRIKTTRGNGRVSTAKWGCCGPLEEVDEDEVKLSYGYNSSRQLIEVIRSATETMPETITSYKRNAEGRVLEKREDTGARKRTINTSYDILGRTITEKDMLGRTTTTRYDKDGLKKTVTLPTGAQEVTEHYCDGSLKYEAKAGKLPVSISYSIGDNCCVTTQMSNRGSNQTLIGYKELRWDGALMRIYVASASQGMASQLISCQEYNSKGQIRSSTERGVKTLFEYDLLGNLSRETRPMADNPTPQNSLVVSHAHAYEKRVDGVYYVKTTTSYDAVGASLTSSKAVLISSLSSTLMNKVIETDIYGKVTTEWTEFAGSSKRIVKRAFATSNIPAETRLTDEVIVYSKDNAGVETTQTLTYTATGSRLATTNGRGNTTITERDIAERVIRVRDGAGNSTVTTYDPTTGKIACLTDRKGKTTRYKYDACGRVTAMYGTGARPVCYGYDEESNLTSQKTFRVVGTTLSEDPSGRSDGDTTLWDYAWPTNLLLRKTYADGSATLMEYGDMNRLEKVTNARGQTMVQTYDSRTGQILSVEYSDTETPDVSYTYNHLGWLTEVTDGAGNRRFDYDHYGNIVEDKLPINGIDYRLQGNHDEFGRFTSYSLMKGAGEDLCSTAYSFGNDGRIESLLTMVNSELQFFQFSYVPGSNLLQSLTMPGGLVNTTSYDPNMDREIGMSLKNASGNVLVSRSYERDAEGFMTERTQKRGNGMEEGHSFGYNDRSELMNAQVRSVSYSYLYDNAGNRLQERADDQATLYDATGLNQYSRIESSGTSLATAYDSDGNQTKVRTTTGIWNVVYNTENRPIRFTSENGQTTVECGYDCQGRRHTKKVTTNGNVTLHERYLYMGYLRLAALDMRNGGILQNALLWNPLCIDNSRTLAVIQGGQLYSCVHDLTKNVTELFDSNGTLVSTCDYTPYGAVSATGTVNSPVQWSNEVYDAELGLTYYNYRHYNPMDGRWISRDPIGEQSDYNLYRFGKNSLIVDNLGLETPSGDPCDKSKEKSKNPKIEGNNKEVSGTVTKKEGDTTVTVKGTIEKGGTAKGSAEVKKEAGDTTVTLGGSTDSDGNNTGTAGVSKKDGDTTKSLTGSTTDSGTSSTTIGVEHKDGNTTTTGSLTIKNDGSSSGKLEIEQKSGSDKITGSLTQDSSGRTTAKASYEKDLGNNWKVNVEGARSFGGGQPSSTEGRFGISWSF